MYQHANFARIDCAIVSGALSNAFETWQSCQVQGQQAVVSLFWSGCWQKPLIWPSQRLALEWRPCGGPTQTLEPKPLLSASTYLARVNIVEPALHSTAQHSTAQHSTAQHSTAQHSTAQHSTAQHSTAQHFAALQYTLHLLHGIATLLLIPRVDHASCNLPCRKGE